MIPEKAMFKNSFNKELSRCMSMNSIDLARFEKKIEKEFEKAKKFLETSHLELGITKIQKETNDEILKENCLIDYECLERVIKN